MRRVVLEIEAGNESVHCKLLKRRNLQDRIGELSHAAHLCEGSVGLSSRQICRRVFSSSDCQVTLSSMTKLVTSCILNFDRYQCTCWLGNVYYRGANRVVQSWGLDDDPHIQQIGAAACYMISVRLCYKASLEATAARAESKLLYRLWDTLVHWRVYVCMS